jgi:cytidylate kinase
MINMKNYVINIGRELGSGGRAIGKILAEKRSLKYYDKELINIAAQKSGLSKEFFEKADENADHNVGGGIFGLRFPFYPTDIMNNNVLNNENLFKIQSDVVKELVENDSCLFVGRCTDYILRDNPNCVNVFITADKNDRITQIIENYEISAEKAEELMIRTDKKRAAFYNYYSLKTWGAAKSYHLCINSSTLGIEKTVEFIDHYIDLKLKK